MYRPSHPPARTPLPMHHTTHTDTGIATDRSHPEGRR
jgi:hypothetical protein